MQQFYIFFVVGNQAIFTYHRVLHLGQPICIDLTSLFELGLLICHINVNAEDLIEEFAVARFELARFFSQLD